MKVSRRDPLVWWAAGLGAGFAPAASGTWGSALAVLLWWFLLADLPVWVQLFITGAYFLSGWAVSTWITRRYAVDDASEIVADEIAGMWLALAVLPKTLWVIAVAFVLFRVLDILKPGPIGWLDREVKGGLGVMLDDVLAGALSGALTFVIWFTI